MRGEVVPGFTIHRVTLANLSQVQDILKVIFPDEMAHFQVAFAAVAKPFYDPETQEAVLRTEQYVLIEKVSGEFAATWGAYYKDDDKDVAIWADYMGVHPAFRKRGLGQKMVKYALKRWLYRPSLRPRDDSSVCTQKTLSLSSQHVKFTMLSDLRFTRPNNSKILPIIIASLDAA